MHIQFSCASLYGWHQFMSAWCITPLDLPLNRLLAYLSAEAWMSVQRAAGLLEPHLYTVISNSLVYTDSSKLQPSFDDICMYSALC